MPRWVKVGLLICLVGCILFFLSQENGFSALKPLLGFDKKYRMEEFLQDQHGVPRLRSLVGQDEFKKYIKDSPYLLGYSYDGTYVAVMVYDPKAKAYRINLFHTGRQKSEETVYAPLKQPSQQTEASESSVKHPNAQEELLSLTQEILDLGYQIKVPSSPREVPVNESIAVKGEKPWEISIKQDDRFAVLTAQRGKNQWELVRFPLEEDEVLAPRWSISSPPSPGNKVTVIAGARSSKRGLRSLVYTIDPSLLSSSWSESHLNERLTKVLGKSARIVHRGEIENRQGPQSILAVQGGKTLPSDSKEILYRGIVDRFVLLDQKKNVYFKGTPDGLVGKKDHFLDPSLSRSGKARFRLLLIGKKVDGESVRILTVDQLNGQGQTIKTYELKWNVEKKVFQWIGKG